MILQTMDRDQMKEHIKLETHQQNGGVCIRATGDLIITNANQLQTKLDETIEEGTIVLTLDLSNVEYIDSFGIGVVVKTKSEVDKRQGRFKVIVNQPLQSLFHKCHLDDYIDLELTE